VAKHYSLRDAIAEVDFYLVANLLSDIAGKTTVRFFHDSYVHVGYIFLR